MTLEDKTRELEERLAKQNIVLEGYKLMAGLSEPDPFKVQKLIEEKLRWLEAKLKDYDDTYRTVMDEKCSKDEVHCTCVPGLRMGIRELETKVGEYEEMLEAIKKQSDVDCNCRHVEMCSCYSTAVSFINLGAEDILTKHKEEK